MLIVMVSSILQHRSVFQAKSHISHVVENPYYIVILLSHHHYHGLVHDCSISSLARRYCSLALSHQFNVNRKTSVSENFISYSIPDTDCESNSLMWIYVKDQLLNYWLNTSVVSLVHILYRAVLLKHKFPKIQKNVIWDYSVRLKWDVINVIIVLYILSYSGLSSYRNWVIRN